MNSKLCKSLAILLGLTVSVSATTTDGTTTNQYTNNAQLSAVQSIGSALRNVIEGQDLNVFMEPLYAAFVAFDENSDGVWSSDELSNYLQTSTPASSIFLMFDVDEDNILSYREVVVMLRVIDSSTVASELMVPNLGYAINGVYKYPYSSGDTQWYEYAASLLFNVYDTTKTGYLTFETFNSVYFNNDFMHRYNFNEDDLITFDEFMKTTFDSAVLERIKALSYRDNMESMGLSVQSWMLNEYFIENLDLKMAPVMTFQDDMLQEFLKEDVCCAGATLCGISTAITSACCISNPEFCFICTAPLVGNCAGGCSV